MVGTDLGARIIHVLKMGPFRLFDLDEAMRVGPLGIMNDFMG